VQQGPKSIMMSSTQAASSSRTPVSKGHIPGSRHCSVNFLPRKSSNSKKIEPQYVKLIANSVE